jgi:acyl-CoA synthetase (AMP-forming)/AMP-acid ligase II
MTAEPKTMGSLADKRLIEQSPLAERWSARNTYELLTQTARRHGDRPALSFQIKSGPRDRAETLSWTALQGQVNQAANLFRRLGVEEGDVVAYLLPNCNETAIALLAGQTAGVVAPINPLLEAGHIAALLRETGAKVLVTLAPFVHTDVNEKAIKAMTAPTRLPTIAIEWPSGVRKRKFRNSLTDECITRVDKP